MQNGALRSRSTPWQSPGSGEEVRPMMRGNVLRRDRRNASIHDGFEVVVSVVGLPDSVDNFVKHQLS